MAIGDEEILPIFHHVKRVAKCGRETEIVVRPCQSLSVTYAESELVDVFIWIVVVGIVVVVRAVIIAVTLEHRVVVVVIRTIVVTAADVCLAREICSY